VAHSRSAFEVVALLEHFVGGLDRLGIHFVGALGHDEFYHFLDDLDVGHFEEALFEAAEAVLAGVAQFGLAGGGAFAEKIAADAFQARRVDSGNGNRNGD
jgi:hypothetical protein